MGEKTTQKVLTALAAAGIKMRPFTREDWYAYAGCEGDAHIAYMNEATVVWDGKAGILGIDWGEELDDAHSVSFQLVGESSD